MDDLQKKYADTVESLVEMLESAEKIKGKDFKLQVALTCMTFTLYIQGMEGLVLIPKQGSVNLSERYGTIYANCIDLQKSLSKLSEEDFYDAFDMGIKMAAKSLNIPLDTLPPIRSLLKD